MNNKTNLFSCSDIKSTILIILKTPLTATLINMQIYCIKKAETYILNNR